MKTSGTRTTTSSTPAGTRVAAPASTPWGRATVVESVTVAQRAGDRRFATVVALLETPDGDRLVRFAYTTAGTARRGPVTLRARDVDRLNALLERTPELRRALGR